MSKEEFIHELELLNIKLTLEQLDQLERYYQLLIEANEKMNLTGITEKEQVYLKHFYDSITLMKAIDLTQPLSVCDIGTGAGFPGMVLKIIFPTLKVTLVDALNKRINFLNQVIEELNLKDIDTVHARMEEYALNHKEEYDIVTARAVAHLSNLLEYGALATKVHGKLIFMKAEVKEEIEESQNALKQLKVKLVDHVSFLLPFEHSKRSILVFEKYEKTPQKYPRKYAEIKKKRL